MSPRLSSVLFGMLAVAIVVQLTAREVLRIRRAHSERRDETDE
jgi:hypothetical protein